MDIFGDKSGKMRPGKKVKNGKMLKKMRKKGKKKDENEGKLEKKKRKMRNVRWKGLTKVMLFFFLLVTLRKPVKLFWVYQNGNFHQEKAKITITPGKHREK